jgi:hypothetical protein
MTIDVYPSANTTTETICTIENPTAYDSKVELNEVHGGAEISVEFVGGNVIDVPAQSSVNVTTTVTAMEKSVYASHRLTVNAKVIEHNNASSPNDSQQSDRVLFTLNPYDDYTAVGDDPIVVVINSDDQHPAEPIAISLSNNGNYKSVLKAITTELVEDLAPYNLSLSVPVETMNIASNKSAPFNFRIGDYGENRDGVNTSSWEVLDNGTKLLYLNSTMFFESEHASAGTSYCLQCNQTVDLNFEIYYVQVESNSGVEETTDEAMPGFELTTGILSIVCAVMIANRKLGRIE